jgi:hypothetical protein
MEESHRHREVCVRVKLTFDPRAHLLVGLVARHATKPERNLR